MTTHCVQFSGGVGSWAAACRVRDERLKEGDLLLLMFADTHMEDEDLYRFLEEAAANVLEGVPNGRLMKLSDGRDPWQVFKDSRFIGNSRRDPCSKLLKRELLWKWIRDNCYVEHTQVHLGIDWTEMHRLERVAEKRAPWRVEAPLCWLPFVEKQDAFDALKAAGIERPRLYDLGFPHNNCGGFCIKAGQAQFAHLYRTLPERYAFHERREEELREFLDRDVAILTDRRGGDRVPLTLRRLRERIEAGEPIGNDWGGCGCALD